MLTITVKIEELQPDVVSLDYTLQGEPTTAEAGPAERISAVLRQCLEGEQRMMADQPDGWARSLEGESSSVTGNIEEIKRRLRRPLE